MLTLIKWSIVVLVVGAVIFFLARWGVGQAAEPNNLGVKDGRLAPCPASPNCVSTTAADTEHGIAPIAYTGETAVAHEAILALLQTDPQFTIIADTPTYIRAEARTAVMQFIDDVEFYFDETESLIHFRSASRLGYGDGGTNRQRMEEIRQMYENR